MNLQQVSQASIEQTHYPLHSIAKIAEVAESERQASTLLIELNEREEFVKRIEAFCDCV